MLKKKNKKQEACSVYLCFPIFKRQAIRMWVQKTISLLEERKWSQCDNKQQMILSVPIGKQKSDMDCVKMKSSYSV